MNIYTMRTFWHINIPMKYEYSILHDSREVICSGPFYEVLDLAHQLTTTSVVVFEQSHGVLVCRPGFKEKLIPFPDNLNVCVIMYQMAEKNLIGIPKECPHQNYGMNFGCCDTHTRASEVALMCEVYLAKAYPQWINSVNSWKVIEDTCNAGDPVFKWNYHTG